MSNNALRLDGWEVASSRDFGDTTEITARYLVLPDTCPKCGVIWRLYWHGSLTADYTDAPYRKHTLIHAEVQSMRCREGARRSLESDHEWYMTAKVSVMHGSVDYSRAHETRVIYDHA